MQPTKSYRDVRVGELLTLLARDYPDHEALVYPDLNLRYTFLALEQQAREIARGLIALGIEPGERVALWATNLPEWVVLQFALAKIGAILVTVNTSLRAHELEYLLKQSETSTLITIAGFRDVDYLSEIAQFLPEIETGSPGELHSAALPVLRQVIFIDNHPGINRVADGLLNYSKLSQLAKSVSEQQLVERESGLQLDDVINMQYTSGTTGFPKGVMLTHRNIVNNGYWLGKAMNYSAQDRLCLPVPLFHCFGCVIGVLGAYTHAVCLVPLVAFDARKVLELVDAERCTALYGVPTMFIAELEDPGFARFNLSRLRTGVMAGALCPEPLMRRVINEMNLTEMIIAYGLTEASPGITHTLRDDTIENRTQTVGKVMPEIEVKIIDPVTFETLPPNTPGELCARGYNIMKGYYNNQIATAEALVTIDGQSGWLRTGDQATLDEAGYLRITGRIKEIIIRGGENIAPKEVEDLLREYWKIADVYVYSVPDERLGEEIAAAIRLKSGENCTAAEIKEFCYGKMAKFKIPRYFRFVDTFPVTASGKVQRYKLREMHLADAKESGK
jgi:fatty-acyl-CoA synthase